MDEGLLTPGEVDRVQDELVDEWDRDFEWMAMEVSADAGEEVKQHAGRKLLRDLQEKTGICVRPHYNEAYFTRGQRHILADEGRIGWHVDYEQRITDLRGEQP
ncbi:ABC-three component system protein [Kitasatospora sp. NPDC059327]|uniref:ABC-three component system protein n=1 Tax=Kitasatospora sp. NPDC059327 TaxID=3346803 RepID=UPI00367E830C